MSVIQFPARCRENKKPPVLVTPKGFNLGDCVRDAKGRITGLGTVVDTFFSNTTGSVTGYLVRFGSRAIEMRPDRLVYASPANGRHGLGPDHGIAR